MIKKSCFVMIILFLVLSCKNGHIADSFDDGDDTPGWLETKITEMSENPEYYGTIVTRCTLHGQPIYHIMIPISSCAYCELYDQSGQKVPLSSNEAFTNYLENCQNEIVIWAWEMESSN